MYHSSFSSALSRRSRQTGSYTIKYQNNNNDDFKLHTANKIILYYNTWRYYRFVICYLLVKSWSHVSKLLSLHSVHDNKHNIITIIIIRIQKGREKCLMFQSYLNSNIIKCCEQAAYIEVCCNIINKNN